MSNPKDKTDMKRENPRQQRGRGQRVDQDLGGGAGVREKVVIPTIAERGLLARADVAEDPDNTAVFVSPEAAQAALMQYVDPRAIVETAQSQQAALAGELEAASRAPIAGGREVYVDADGVERDRDTHMPTFSVEGLGAARAAAEGDELPEIVGGESELPQLTDLQPLDDTTEPAAFRDIRVTGDERPASYTVSQPTLDSGVMPDDGRNPLLERALRRPATPGVEPGRPGTPAPEGRTDEMSAAYGGTAAASAFMHAEAPTDRVPARSRAEAQYPRPVYEEPSTGTLHEAMRTGAPVRYPARELDGYAPIAGESRPVGALSQEARFGFAPEAAPQAPESAPAAALEHVKAQTARREQEVLARSPWKRRLFMGLVAAGALIAGALGYDAYKSRQESHDYTNPAEDVAQQIEQAPAMPPADLPVEASVATPEKAPEQQAERMMIGNGQGISQALLSGGVEFSQMMKALELPVKVGNTDAQLKDTFVIARGGELGMNVVKNPNGSVASVEFTNAEGAQLSAQELSKYLAVADWRVEKAKRDATQERPTESRQRGMGPQMDGLGALDMEKPEGDIFTYRYDLPSNASNHPPLNDTTPAFIDAHKGQLRVGDVYDPYMPEPVDAHEIARLEHEARLAAQHPIDTEAPTELEPTERVPTRPAELDRSLWDGPDTSGTYRWIQEMQAQEEQARIDAALAQVHAEDMPTETMPVYKPASVSMDDVSINMGPTYVPERVQVPSRPEWMLNPEFLKQKDEEARLGIPATAEPFVSRTAPQFREAPLMTGVTYERQVQDISRLLERTPGSNAHIGSLEVRMIGLRNPEPQIRFDGERDWTTLTPDMADTLNRQYSFDAQYPERMQNITKIEFAALLPEGHPMRIAMQRSLETMIQQADVVGFNKKYFEDQYKQLTGRTYTEVQAVADEAPTDLM